MAHSTRIWAIQPNLYRKKSTFTPSSFALVHICSLISKTRHGTSLISLNHAPELPRWFGLRYLLSQAKNRRREHPLVTLLFFPESMRAAATPCAPPPPSCRAAIRFVVIASPKSSMAPGTSRVLLPQPPSTEAPPLGGSGLPLIWCPYCGKGRILELMSNTDEHPMERFFKCPRKYRQVRFLKFLVLIES